MSKLARLETIIIFLAILSLWLRILGWQHPAFDVVLYVFLALMILITIRRVRMVRKVFDDGVEIEKKK